MQSKDFSLEANAFRVVGATYTSTSSDIADLVEEAEYSGSISEDVLQKAQQTLLTPRLRIAAELAWLPELSATQISKVISDLGKLTQADLMSQISHLPELARANILADMCASQPVGTDAISALLTAWEAMNEDELFEFIKSTRRTAGQPVPDNKLFATTLQELKAQHAMSAVAGLMRSADPSSMMRALLDQETARDIANPLVPVMVREFEKRNERRLSRVSEEIAELTSKAKSATSAIPSVIASISDQLNEWSILTAPLAKFYEWRGHPDPRSKALFYEVRDFLLHLANNDNKFDEARALVVALQGAFYEADELRKVADKDLSDVDLLIADRRAAELFEPLVDACEAVKKSHLDFAKVAKRHGLHSGSPAPISNFIAAIERYLSSGGDADLAYAVVRDLSLLFNNEHTNPELAYKIVEFAAGRTSNRFSEATQNKFLDDSETLFRNWKIREIEKYKGDLSRAISAVKEAIAIAPPGIRGEFLSLLSTLEAGRNNRRIKLAAYVAIALVIGIPVLLANSKKSSTAYRPSGGVSITYPNAKNTNNQYNTPEAVSYQIETMPPAGAGLTLNRSQIRYCVYQGKRLSHLRNMASTNAAISQFNTLIADFNSRCSNYRYMQNDMSVVEVDASKRDFDFLKEAAAMAKGW